MNWQDKKRIGEALGYPSLQVRMYGAKSVGPVRYWSADEERYWNDYKPDILGQVIPWLEKNADCAAFEHFGNHWRGDANPWMVSTGDTFSEAVCALMLAVLDAAVPA